MNYGEVLEKSWKIVWKNKILWLFGLLASCGRASGGSGGGGGSSGGGNGSSSGFVPGMPFQNVPPWLEDLARTFERMVENGTIWLVVAGIIVFSLLLAVVMLLVGAIGRAGLARGAWRADAGETPLTFRTLWQDSLRYFWRVLLLVLLIAVAATILIFLLLAPLVLFGFMTLGIGLLCLIPFICLLVPVGIAVGVLEEIAVIAIVGEDKGILESIRRAWEILRANVGPMVVMTLILLVGGGIVRLLIGLPAILILFPIAIGLIAGGQTALVGGFMVAGAVLLVYLPVAILLSSVLQAYLGSAWVLTYRRLISKETEATIEPERSEDLPEGSTPAV